MKHCLVTGATGFIGRELCQRLQKENIGVRALLRRPIEGPWQESVLADIAGNKKQFLTIEAVKNIDTIFHLAGITHSGASYFTPKEQYWAVNVEATQRLLMLAIEAKVSRFIYMSSVKAINPSDNYGFSKQEAERYILAAGKKYGFHVCILRPTLVYGASVKGNLRSLLRGVDQGWFPPLPETDNQRTMVSKQDLVDVALLVANHPNANGKIYTVTDGQLYSTRQIYNAVRQAFNLPARKWSLPLRGVRIMAKMADGIQQLTRKHLPFSSEVLDKLLASTVYSSQLIKNELGWRPKIDFYQALPEMVTAYREDVK